jgi:outer membrane protein assembly factor BamB
MNSSLRKVTHLSVLLVCVFLASCSGKKEVVLESAKPAAKPKIQSNIKLDRIWSVNLGSSFKSDIAGFQLQHDGEFLYAIAQSGDVGSIDIQAGSFNWKTDLKEKISAGLSVGFDALYAANDQGQVLALDKTSGKPFWRKQVSSEVLTSPVESRGVVIVRSLDGKVSGLNAKTGDELWALQRDFPSLSLRRDVAPLLVGNVALLGLSSGNVVAVNIKAGQAVWDIPISTPSGINELDRMRDIASKPLISGSLFFANSYQGEIIGIDISSRKLLWKMPISSHQQMVSDGSVIFATGSDSSIVALSNDNGELLWKSEVFLRRGVSSPTIYGNHILVFGNDGDMYLLDKDSGELIGNYNFPGKRIIGSPVVFQDKKSGKLTFSALSDNGSIYTYQTSK